MSFKKDYGNIIGAYDGTTLSELSGVQITNGLGIGTITLTNGSGTGTLNGVTITNVAGTNVGATTNKFNIGTGLGTRISVIDQLTGDVYNLTISYLSSTQFTVTNSTKLSYSLESRVNTVSSFSGPTGTYKYYLGNLSLNKSPNSIILGNSHSSHSGSIINNNSVNTYSLSSSIITTSTANSIFSFNSSSRITGSGITLISSSTATSITGSNSIYLHSYMVGTSAASNSVFINSDTITVTGSLIGIGLFNTNGATVSSSFNSIIGGITHRIIGGTEHSIILGGTVNIINTGNNENYNSILGGNNGSITFGAGNSIIGGLNCIHQTASNYSVILSGRSNTNEGYANVISGGYTGSGASGNSITSAAYSAGIIGGYANTISGALSVILGGQSNTISGIRSVATGSNNNIAAGYSFATGDNHTPTSSATASLSYGTNTTATTYGERVAGTGLLSGMKAQEGTIIISNVTTNATVTNLVDGSGNVGINIPAGESWVMTFTLQATITSVTNRSNSRVWNGKYIVKNVGGVMSATTVLAINSIPGETGTTAFAASFGTFTGTRLRLTVTGAASTTVSWLAKVDYTKIQFV